MQGVVFLIGESFREGAKTRIIGTQASYDQQLLASKSQVDFFTKLQNNHNCCLTVILITYSTPFEKDLLSVYEPFLADFRFLDPQNRIGINGINVLCQNYIKKIEENHNFALYLRVDLFIKPHLSEAYNPHDQRILFCFRSTAINRQTHEFWPLFDENAVGDMITHVPKKFYYATYTTFILCHEGLTNLLNIGINLNDIDVMSNSVHDTDTMWDWNPFFFNNRSTRV